MSKSLWERKELLNIKFLQETLIVRNTLSFSITLKLNNSCITNGFILYDKKDLNHRYKLWLDYYI